MSSFSRFISKASSVLSGLAGALGMSGSCTFTLSGSGYSVDFPVLPSSFTVTNPRNNQTINVISVGDVNMIGNAGLASIKFDSFFPANNYPFLKTFMITPPYNYVQKVKAMQSANQPCQITITGTDVSLPVTIETFEYSEKDGSGDVYFSMELKEYRYMSTSSNLINGITGMTGRTAGVLNEKQMTCIHDLDTMDTAAKAIQKTASIAKQCTRTLELYKAMAKSGGVRPGVLIGSTVKGITAGGKSLLKW